MRIQVQFLALLSGLRIQHCRKLQHTPGAPALIWHLAWEFPYAGGVAIKRREKRRKKKKKKLVWVPSSPSLSQVLDDKIILETKDSQFRIHGWHQNIWTSCNYIQSFVYMFIISSESMGFIRFSQKCDHLTPKFKNYLPKFWGTSLRFHLSRVLSWNVIFLWYVLAHTNYLVLMLSFSVYVLPFAQDHLPTPRSFKILCLLKCIFECHQGPLCCSLWDTTVTKHPSLMEFIALLRGRLKISKQRE